MSRPQAANGEPQSLSIDQQQFERHVDNAPLKKEASSQPLAARKGTGNRKWWIVGVAAAIVVIALAVVLPVYFVVIKPKSSSDGTGGDSSGSGSGGGNSSSPGNGGGGTDNPPVTKPTTGGDGSEITMANGKTFTYKNAFGGFWVQDPQNPFNLDARANDYTPPLNKTWRWGRDRVYGVNLGGAFVLEPFITPHFFQKYHDQGAEDEFTLTTAMRDAGNIKELEDHYETFITEQDIAEIAGAGLNWMRVPLGFWAVEKYDNEPFIERTSWIHFTRIVEWARKYGIRIYLDIHALPGGQNALGHSARRRHYSFLNGAMGYANAQRYLYYLRVITEFISQPQYQPVVPLLGLVNEPLVQKSTQPTWRSFYLEAYRVIRSVSGFGEGNGPYIVVGDGFIGPAEWVGVMPGADRFMMDHHPYMAFDFTGPIRPNSLTDPAPDGKLGGIYPKMACDRWATEQNLARKTVGVTVGGEFSAAVNDCGFYMRGVDLTNFNRACALYNNWESWSDDFKAGLLNFVLASFDAMGDFFFWTWKIGPTAAGRVESPMWSYQLGLEHGWMPKDPRDSLGKCAALGSNFEPFDGVYQPWQTGGVVNPTIPADYLAANPWPPLSIPNAGFAVNLLPTYTASGAPITLPVPTFTGAPASVTENVDGWFKDEDKAPAVGPKAGCRYPDQYTVTALVPAPTGPFCP